MLVRLRMSFITCASFKLYLTFIPDFSALTTPVFLSWFICQVKACEETPRLLAMSLWRTELFWDKIARILAVVSCLMSEINCISVFVKAFCSKYLLFWPSVYPVIKPVCSSTLKWYWTTPTDKPKLSHMPLKCTPGLLLIKLYISSLVGWSRGCVELPCKLVPIAIGTEADNCCRLSTCWTPLK